MKNKEKFLKLVSEKKSNTIIKNRDRISNRAMLRESQSIALKVLTRLDELQWSQKKLAELLNVKPQQVSKLISGKENSKIDTLIKLEEVLEITIFSTKLERLFEEVYDFFKATNSIKVDKRITPINIPNFDFNIDFEDPTPNRTYNNVTPRFYPQQHFA